MTFGVTIPSKYASGLGRVFADCEGVAVGVRDNFVSFESGGVVVQVPVLAGLYPRVRDCFGRKAIYSLECKTAELVAALRSVLLTTEDEGFRRATIERSGDTLVVRSRPAEANEESVAEVACEGTAPQGVLGCYQIKFLLAALSIHGESFEFIFGDKEGGFEAHSPLWRWVIFPLATK